MNKVIKIIDLLNMIEDGKELPVKIKYNFDIFYLNKLDEGYYYTEKAGFGGKCLYNCIESLHDVLEIIEENEKGISREELENRIENALEFLETQHGTYPSGKMWREALKNVLQGKNADDVYFEKSNKIEKIDHLYILQTSEFTDTDVLQDINNKNIRDKIDEIIDYINEKWGTYE